MGQMLQYNLWKKYWRTRASSKFPISAGSSYTKLKKHHDHHLQETLREQKHGETFACATIFILNFYITFMIPIIFIIVNTIVIFVNFIIFRKLCVSRNTARLSSFPSHPSLACPTCAKKMRLWPEQVHQCN